jgi:uncharacterized membrane protein
MTSMMTVALLGGYVEWWQFILLAGLVALIIFWVLYRRKQM